MGFNVEYRFGMEKIIFPANAYNLNEIRLVFKLIGGEDGIEGHVSMHRFL